MIQSIIACFICAGIIVLLGWDYSDEVAESKRLENRLLRENMRRESCMESLAYLVQWQDERAKNDLFRDCERVQEELRRYEYK